MMTLQQAMMQYGTPDKVKFECAYPEWQEKRPDSTFYADFSVADCYDVNAIKDTYKRAFNGWKNNYKMLTELVAVLNHKIWAWHKVNDEYAQLYDKLWKEADAYGCDNLKDDELKHFLYVLD